MAKVIRECRKYGFTYHESVNGIFIRTHELAGWYISFEGNDNPPRLYHENYRHVTRYGTGILERYHEHNNVKEANGVEYVRYISNHDRAATRRKGRTIFEAVSYKKSKDCRQKAI